MDVKWANAILSTAINKPITFCNWFACGYESIDFTFNYDCNLRSFLSVFCCFLFTFSIMFFTFTVCSMHFQYDLTFSQCCMHFQYVLYSIYIYYFSYVHVLFSILYVLVFTFIFMYFSVKLVLPTALFKLV